MAESLLSPEWVETLSRFSTLYVGFSGGLDSTVLLHALCTNPSLAPKVRAVHVHHGLSAHADAWEAHCARVCETLSVPLLVRRVAFSERDNLEERARLARYAVFAECLDADDCLVLGHHQNDQAETVLMRLLRGSGVEGLAGMRAIRTFAAGMLARPLLNCPRARLEAVAERLGLCWVEDDSNACEALSRNFIRQSILPLIAGRYPGVIETLSRSAGHFEAAQVNLETLAHLDCTALATSSDRLALSYLLPLSPFRRDNVLRVWLRANGARMPSAAVFQRITRELLTARPDAMPRVAWGEVQLCRYRDTLWLLPKSRVLSEMDAAPPFMTWDTFPDPLQLHDGRVLRASPAQAGLSVPPAAAVRTGFRAFGERMRWRGQTKAIKKLFQEWGVPPWERARIPLVYINDELAAIVGFAIADPFFCRDGGWVLDIMHP